MNYLLPISIAMGLIGYGLIARWYIWPWILLKSKADSLIALILPHVFRYIGLAFLLDGITNGTLDPRFAEPAAWGDLAAAILALIAVLMLKTQSKAALAVVWVFNVVGFADLINAIFQGLLYVPDAQFGAAYFIPAMIVPGLLILHGLIFLTLIRKQ